MKNLSLFFVSDAFDDVKAPQNISKYSEETVCFYMFVDEETESILKRERGINSNKKVGIWRVVVVHNLPYSDGRRNGKVNIHTSYLSSDEVMHSSYSKLEHDARQYCIHTAVTTAFLL